MFSLAYSYSFLPSTFTAEYIGTSWSYVPLKELIVFIISFLLKVLFSSFNMLPVISKVSVKIPSLKVAIYSLSWFVSKFDSFVALPIRQTKTPVARGSKVPVWPICLVSSIWFSLLTTSLLVISFGLFIIIAPVIRHHS